MLIQVSQMQNKHECLYLLSQKCVLVRNWELQGKAFSGYRTVVDNQGNGLLGCRIVPFKFPSQRKLLASFQKFIKTKLFSWACNLAAWITLILFTCNCSLLYFLCIFVVFMGLIHFLNVYSWFLTYFTCDDKITFILFTTLIRPLALKDAVYKLIK